MHQHRAGFCLHARASFGARGKLRFAESDLPAVGFDRLAFHFWRVARHHDIRRNATPARRTRHRGAMIPAGRRDDAARDFLLAHRENSVAGPANFERPGFLKIVTLEKQPRANNGVEGGASQHRRAVNARRDARMRGEDRRPVWRGRFLPAEFNLRAGLAARHLAFSPCCCALSHSEHIFAGEQEEKLRRTRIQFGLHIKIA